MRKTKLIKVYGICNNKKPHRQSDVVHRCATYDDFNYLIKP
jgi:hypothetical protein